MDKGGEGGKRGDKLRGERKNVRSEELLKNKAEDD